VAVHAHAEDGDADAARVREARARNARTPPQVGRGAVGDVAAVAAQARASPGVLLHERAERARIVPGQDDLVQVEARGAREVERPAAWRAASSS
jgi:hypothetical protein